MAQIFKVIHGSNSYETRILRPSQRDFILKNINFLNTSIIMSVLFWVGLIVLNTNLNVFFISQNLSVDDINNNNVYVAIYMPVIIYVLLYVNMLSDDVMLLELDQRFEVAEDNKKYWENRSKTEDNEEAEESVEWWSQEMRRCREEAFSIKYEDKRFIWFNKISRWIVNAWFYFTTLIVFLLVYIVVF